MLPTPIYESLPYSYLGVAVTGLMLGDPHGMVLPCALVLSGCAGKILLMRRAHRVKCRDQPWLARRH